MKKILFISGWAHSPTALKPLADKFSVYNIELESIDSIVLKSGLEFKKENFSVALELKLKEYSEPPIVIAWSMGAMVLFECLSKNSALINRAVFLGATLKFCTGLDYSFGIDPKNVKFMIRMLKRNRNTLLSNFYKDCAQPNSISEITLLDKINSISNISTEFLVEGLNYLIDTDLRDVKNFELNNSIAIHGKNDIVIPSTAGDYFCKSLNIKQLNLIKDTGHDLVFFTKNDMYRIIDNFLTS